MRIYEKFSEMHSERCRAEKEKNILERKLAGHVVEYGRIFRMVRDSRKKKEDSDALIRELTEKKFRVPEFPLFELIKSLRGKARDNIAMVIAQSGNALASQA